MYQIAIIVLIILPSLYFGGKLYRGGIRFKDIYAAFLNSWNAEIYGFRENKRDNFSRSLTHLKQVLYYITVILALILMLTGFIPAALLGKHLFGIFLLIHVLAAPFFCLSSALFVLMSANQNSFSKTDLDLILNGSWKTRGAGSFTLYRKISFWTFSFFSIPAIFSIALSLFPIFGTDGLNNLLMLHQISVIFLTLSFLAHSYCLLNSTLINQQKN